MILTNTSFAWSNLPSVRRSLPSFILFESLILFVLSDICTYIIIQLTKELCQAHFVNIKIKLTKNNISLRHIVDIYIKNKIPIKKDLIPVDKKIYSDEDELSKYVVTVTTTGVAVKERTLGNLITGPEDYGKKVKYSVTVIFLK